MNTVPSGSNDLQAGAAASLPKVGRQASVSSGLGWETTGNHVRVAWSLPRQAGVLI